MKRAPDVVFVIDGVFEEQALKEANSLNLTTFAILNTNGNDELVQNCIPANTNSVKSIEYIADELKSCLSGSVKASVNTGKVRKITDTKVSGAKPAAKKTVVVKKEEK